MGPESPDATTATPPGPAADTATQGTACSRCRNRDAYPPRIGSPAAGLSAATHLPAAGLSAAGVLEILDSRSFKRPQLAAVYMHGSLLLLGHGDRESPVALGPAGA